MWQRWREDKSKRLDTVCDLSFTVDQGNVCFSTAVSLCGSHYVHGGLDAFVNRDPDLFSTVYFLVCFPCKFFCLIPCGRLSWLPVSFCLNVKYTVGLIVSYYIVLMDILYSDLG